MWEEIQFTDSIVKNKIGRNNQINASEIQPFGKYPVIDQGQNFIAGYCDDETKLIKDELPFIIFGDHTRCFKYVDFPFILGADGTKVLKPNSELFDSKFFYFALLSLNIPNRGYNRHFTLLREKKVAKPEISEQRRIAHVLSVVQTAIEQQARLITLTRELKAALMRQLFTEGLPAAADRPHRSSRPVRSQKMTEIGLVPESWTFEQLSSLCTIKHGFGFKGEYFKPEGKYILLTPGHFFEEGGFRNQEERTKFYTGKIPDGFILQKDDLLIAMTEQKAGLLGSSIIIPESNKYLHNQRLGLIQNLDDRLNKEFLYYYFNTSYPRTEISSTATGSKVRHTSPSKVLNLKIAFPCIEEQKQIVDTLKTVDCKLTILNEKKFLLEELFRTLLHHLMTGQVRTTGLDLTGLGDL